MASGSHKKKWKLTCPKCADGESKTKVWMEEGFIVDETDSGAKRAGWATDIEKSFFVAPKAKDARQIHSFRCPACGYLESYAP